MASTLRTLMDFKGKRIEIEYQKTIATQMIATRLATLVANR